MNTYCAVYQLNPRRVKEYRDLHAACWPEQIKALREAGAKKMEIFLQDSLCVITYECEDFDLFLENLSKSEVNARWGKRMEGMFLSETRFTGDGRIRPAEKIFSI